MVANGTALNAGQVGLVRAMATSGARLQLAIAPAGTGKTTALHALAAAWTGGGGEVIGLAPSAAAAAQLRDQIRCHTDTLAKLTWSIHNDDLPGWVSRIGPSTLVIIDEAGMADTLTLDTAVAVHRRPGRQCAAGRRRPATRRDRRRRRPPRHPARARRGPAHRSSSASPIRPKPPPPSPCATAVPKRSASTSTSTGSTSATKPPSPRTCSPPGRPTAATGSTRSCSPPPANSPPNSTSAPAPTASHRLPDRQPDAAPVALADGNQASVGDLVITRANDRRLRVTGTDWVKNGDRWTITTVHRDGALTVKHTQHRRTVRLPADYVQASVELGYATTVHGAQGVTADTMHGLATGAESRQQLYTMLTRGRTANHLYLQVVGDGDPHSVIHPDTIRPRTPVDLLEQILARDDTPHSATTTQTRAARSGGPARRSHRPLPRRPLRRRRRHRRTRRRRPARHRRRPADPGPDR